MLPNDAQIISVDDHVIEHPQVWLDRLPAKYQDVAPRIERDETGNDFWMFENEKSGNFALNAVAGKDPKDYALDPRSYDDMLPGCHNIEDRLRDMDIEGVHAQLCFPNMAGFAGKTFGTAKDPQLGLECVRAYNDFIIDEWCAYNPDRQIPLMTVPYWDVDETVKEIYRTAEKGAKSFTFPELPDRIGLPSWHTDHWDPVLAAAQETGLPLSLHFGSGGSPQVSPEGGIGWMPYVLERVDYVWERHRWYNDVNRDVRPSEIFRDHLWGCFISDDAGIEARHRIGIDNIMFESDYPHSDSQWPHTRKILEESMANVPDDEAVKMVETNAREFYNFPRKA